MSALAIFPQSASSASRAMPANLDLEHAILGIVLYDNEALDLIEGLAAEHFYEAAHGRIWQAAQDLAAKGMRAEAILIAEKLSTDPAFVELGGISFLAHLVDRAPSTKNAPDYAKALISLAQRRELIRLSENLIDAARAEDDAQAVIGMAEAGLLAMQVRSRPVDLISAGAAADMVLADLDASPDEAKGIVTGLSKIDEVLGPLLPGNVIAMAGRTSMGKSAAAEVIAYNIALQGYGVIQISTEMAIKEMAQRHLADICQRMHGPEGPEYLDIRRRRVSQTQRAMLQAARDQFDTVPLFMIKQAAPKFSTIRSIARRQAAIWARQGIALGAVFIDHMGHVRLDQPSRDRYSDQTAISNMTKELADELGCPVFPLLQINRQTENRDDKRPGLSDIRDSGAWEQDADVVFGFYREAYYAQRQAEPKSGKSGSKEDAAWAEWDRARRSPMVEAIILKARFGPPQTLQLWGDVARNALRDYSPVGGLL